MDSVGLGEFLRGYQAMKFPGAQAQLLQAR